MNKHKQTLRRKRGQSYRRGSSQALPNQLPLALDVSGEIAHATLGKPTSHPNIFRKRIVSMDGHPKIGNWVRVLAPVDEESSEMKTVGYGLYNPKSEIAIRLVSRSSTLPDQAFWKGVFERAVSLRTDVLKLDEQTDCYRVLHAESDGFPGLVVDRFADCLSAEVFSAAIAPRTREVVTNLSAALGTRHWLIQPGPHLQSQEGFEMDSFSSEDLPGTVTVHEGNVRFQVSFRDSHKTGFFCDQRENRQKLAQYVRGKSVLDVCCYTGGFAVTAAKLGEAGEVSGVDLDASPLQIAKKNADMNGVRVRFRQADAFAYMRDMLRAGRNYDVVVLDPPKLIRNRGELDEGTRKHFDLNRLAMQLVKPGGLMLTCSCAGLLQAGEFTRLVRAAARSAFQPSDWNPSPQPRDMQILGTNGAAACHPVSAACPETEYLKAMWLRL